MTQDSRPTPPEAANLRRLFWLRNIAIAAALSVMAIAHAVMGIGLAIPALLATLGAWAAVNAATLWRMQRAWPVHDGELFGHLVADTLVLALLFHFSEGPANPFVTLFLVPIVVAATLLPGRYTWAIVALTLACYSTLLWNYVGTPMAGVSHEHGQTQSFERHVFGMWINFVLTALFVAGFAVKMRESVRERDRLLARARERTLRDEQIVALGAQAASAAHALGTPLATLAVLSKELERDPAATPALRETATTMRAQIEIIKQHVADMLTRAGQSRAGGLRRVGLDAEMRRILDTWQVTRPDAVAAYRTVATGDAPEVLIDAQFERAMMNLLDNALEASPEGIEVEIGWDAAQVHIEILDHGPGLTPEALAQAGQTIFSTKGEHGSGLGMVLANASIEALGGRVRWFNRRGGGAVTRVDLPRTPEAQA